MCVCWLHYFYKEYMALRRRGTRKRLKPYIHTQLTRHVGRWSELVLLCWFVLVPALTGASGAAAPGPNSQCPPGIIGPMRPASAAMDGSIRVCLVELWLWKKAAVGCELWESCCGLWAIEKLKAIWLNKYKIYLLSLSLLKQLWKSFLCHQFRKAESQKPKAGSNQLSKMYYGKAAASEKAGWKSSPFGWAFGFLD